jgi:hypothetical protein
MQQEVINKIKKSLLDNDIDYSEAYEEIKRLSKAWHRKEWKVKRRELIKDFCEKCGVKSAVFVMQHTKHPEQFHIIKERIGISKQSEFEKENRKADLILSESRYKYLSQLSMLDSPFFYEKQAELLSPLFTQELEQHLDSIKVVRMCCPICSRLITKRNYRKTMAIYKCEMKHEFVIPNEVDYYSVYRTRDRQKARCKSLMKEIRKEKFEYDKKLYAIRRSIDAIVGRISLLESIEQHEEYMSLKHTMTYCKSCAYKEDKENGLIR